MNRAVAYIIVVLAVFKPFGLDTAVAQAETFKQQKTYTLDEDYHFTVSTATTGQAKITLFWHDTLQESFVLGNANITEQGVKQYTFCKDCRKVHLITLYDRSSTYGATTQFIIDRSSGLWSIQKLPFDRSIVQDIDHDGICEITDLRQQIHYHWVNGFLIKQQTIL